VIAWEAGRTVRAEFRERRELVPGATLRGPAVIVDDGATLWVAAGWRARSHDSGAVVLTPARLR
jgi:N-methylhydantoinase A/oxoprolinase/acetone carboxylase beta subunit